MWRIFLLFLELCFLSWLFACLLHAVCVCVCVLYRLVLVPFHFLLSRSCFGSSTYVKFSLFTLTALVLSWLSSHSIICFFLEVHALRAVQYFLIAWEQGSREDSPEQALLDSSGSALPLVVALVVLDQCSQNLVPVGDGSPCAGWITSGFRAMPHSGHTLESPLLPEAASSLSTSYVSLKQLVTVSTISK